MQGNNLIDTLIVLARREKILEILNRAKAPYHWSEDIKEETAVKKAQGSAVVLDVTLEGKKIFQILDGFDYPIKGFADTETVAIVAVYKKLIPLIAKSLKRQNIFQKSITILAITYNIPVLSQWLSTLFGFGKYLLKDDYYQESTQEIRRVLAKYIDINFVNAVGLIWEYDNAYRYRGQDILPLFNKNAMQGYFQARREVLRVFDIWLSKDGETRDKMIFVRKALNYILLIPRVNKLVRSIINDLDMSKIGFDEIDKYWVKMRTESYKFNIKQ
jgi:hypothetical protein